MTTTPITATTASKRSGGIGETLRTIIYAVLIALVVRSFAYEPFYIPSGSMKPTLLIDDYLFVSKFSYGYSRYSFPFAFPPFGGRILASQPERGDVIVFRHPAADRSDDLVKRLIGLPGDRIQVREDRLYINDVMVERRQVEDYVEPGTSRPVTRYIETLPNGVEHEILESSGDTGLSDNTPVYTVPEGRFFFMGDNRDNSGDSRADVGFVPFENLVGRAEFIWFSLEDSSFWEVWKWPTALRLSRMFTGID